MALEKKVYIQRSVQMLCFLPLNYIVREGREWGWWQWEINTKVYWLLFIIKLFRMVVTRTAIQLHFAIWKVGSISFILLRSFGLRIYGDRCQILKWINFNTFKFKSFLVLPLRSKGLWKEKSWIPNYRNYYPIKAVSKEQYKTLGSLDRSL